MSSIDIMDRDDTTRIVFKVALNTHKHNSFCENCYVYSGVRYIINTHRNKIVILFRLFSGAIDSSPQWNVNDTHTHTRTHTRVCIMFCLLFVYISFSYFYLGLRFDSTILPCKQLSFFKWFIDFGYSVWPLVQCIHTPTLSHSFDVCICFVFVIKCQSNKINIYLFSCY